MRKRLIEILLWIAAITVPWIASCAIYFLGTMLSLLGAARVMGSDLQEYYRPVIMAICNAPAAFVIPYLACLIAPKGKIITAIVLGTIAATLQGFAILINFGQWWLNLNSLCSIIGSILGIVKVHQMMERSRGTVPIDVKTVEQHNEP